MTLCSDGHYEICYEDKLRTCPLCEKLIDITDLNNKIDTLEAEANNE